MPLDPFFSPDTSGRVTARSACAGLRRGRSSAGVSTVAHGSRSIGGDAGVHQRGHGEDRGPGHSTRESIVRLCVAAHREDDFRNLFVYVPSGGLHFLAFEAEVLLWRGPLGGRSEQGLIPTPEQSGIMILRLSQTPVLNLDSASTIECQGTRIW